MADARGLAREGILAHLALDVGELEAAARIVDARDLPAHAELDARRRALGARADVRLVALDLLEQRRHALARGRHGAQTVPG